MPRGKTIGGHHRTICSGSEIEQGVCPAHTSPLPVFSHSAFLPHHVLSLPPLLSFPSAFTHLTFFLIFSLLRQEDQPETQGNGVL